MHTVRNRKASTPSQPNHRGNNGHQVTPPFLLRDKTPDRLAAAGAPPSFPADITIATSPRLRAAAIAVPDVALRQSKAEKDKKARRKKNAAVRKRPKGAKSARKAAQPKSKATINSAVVAMEDAALEAVAAAPLAAVEPIRPVAPVYAPPNPTRPRPQRVDARARQPKRKAAGSMIAALDLRPQLPLDLPERPVISLALAIPPAATRSPSPQVDGAAAPTRTSPGAAASDHDLSPLPRAAAITPWQRNGFLDAVAYWLRGAGRSVARLFSSPTKAAATANVAAKRAPAPASRIAQPMRRPSSLDAELLALRAENENLRQQVQLLLARAQAGGA